MNAALPVVGTIEGGVCRLVLNRPERLNAFTVPMHEALLAALNEAAADDRVRVVVLTGAGRAFSAGQDLAERDVDGYAPLDLGRNIEAYYNPLVRRLLALRVPLVAAGNGVAAGAGASIALLADFVIAAESARFVQSFVKIGLLPDSGGTWTLPHLIGQARALGMAIGGEPVSARQAEAWGMIWRAVPDESFADEVKALAARLAAAPTQGIVATRGAIRGAWQRSLDQQLDVERDAQRRLGGTDDYAEGVRAFKAKRPPRFTGR